MLEVAWGLRKILSGEMKSDLGLWSKSWMLEVASGKKSKSEMLRWARIYFSF
jgi:sugar (pentulose or hexulose) kinase